MGPLEAHARGQLPPSLASSSPGSWRLFPRGDGATRSARRPQPPAAATRSALPSASPPPSPLGRAAPAVPARSSSSPTLLAPPQHPSLVLHRSPSSSSTDRAEIL
ncbi:hypothetical protein U9M48_044906 [Paspalum notatum var. saurae]|uniref:Uncharacterized protein n=1 Tax=Paspalum notatum var. saurae TaxID=547442 RepID=A0AAQ3XJ05_PASNO